MPGHTCSTFFSAWCFWFFFFFFFLGVLFSLAFGLFFETFASRVLAVEVLNHFVFSWMHRARWSSYCGSFCGDGRQATVLEPGQQGIFMRVWSVSSMGRHAVHIKPK